MLFIHPRKERLYHALSQMKFQQLVKILLKIVLNNSNKWILEISNNVDKEMLLLTNNWKTKKFKYPGSQTCNSA